MYGLTLAHIGQRLLREDVKKVVVLGGGDRGGGRIGKKKLPLCGGHHQKLPLPQKLKMTPTSTGFDPLYVSSDFYSTEWTNLHPIQTSTPDVSGYATEPEVEVLIDAEHLHNQLLPLSCRLNEESLHILF